MQPTVEHNLEVPGVLVAWGLHSDGQAGVGRVDSPNLVIRPVPVLGLEGSVALVASGFRHSLFLTEGGRVFVCGFNRNGRLGLLSTTAKLDVAVPLQFPAPIRLVAVSCGYGHSAAVAADGRLFVWGHAADGALGLGDLKTASVDSPAPVTEGIAGAVASVSCGGSHTLALTVAGVLYGAGSVEALGPALAGPSFKSWEEAGEISLAKAGGKCCIAVAESRPHDVYVFGTIDFESLEKPPCDPQLRMVGAKGLIIDAGACTKMCSVLDDEGNLYVSKSSAFQQVPNISADQIGQGVVSLVYLEKKTKAVKIYSGSGQPTLVEGVGPSSKVFCGHRTFFALGLQKVDVTNRDCLGKLRGGCSNCEKCPRFGGALGVTVNMHLSTALACLRCGCDASLHQLKEEVVLPQHEPKPRVEWPETKSRSGAASVAADGGLGMPLDLCELAIANRQKVIRKIQVDKVSSMRVFAVSDIHTDFKGNMRWLEEFTVWAMKENFRNDVIIVAGDISHDMGIIETTLRLFRKAFGHVFHICGNHELWVAPMTSTCKHAMHKLMEIQDLCDKLDVYYSPVVFSSDDARSKPLIICPLLTWYEPQFAGKSSRGAMEGFDMACRWMYSDQELTTKFLEFNPVDELVSRFDVKNSRCVTFSHFIPRDELFFGWPALREVMGSRRIDEVLRKLSPAVHVFGHSHMDVDRVHQGVRYVQHHLGSEPYHRTNSSFPRFKPKLVLDAEEK